MTNTHPETKTADCRNCGPGIAVYLKAGTWYCLPARVERDRARKQAALAARRAALLDHCEICESRENLRWDHNHTTGRFRGTLCNDCNSGIGMLQDDPDVALKAATYLDEHAARQET